MRFKNFIFSSLFLMTALFITIGNQAQAMDQNELNIYKAIKTNFFIAADKLNLNTRQTWTGPKLWDTYNHKIQTILETPNLTTNQIFDELTLVFKNDMQLGHNGANIIMRNAKHGGILAASDPALVNTKTKVIRTQSDIYKLLQTLTHVRQQSSSSSSSSSTSSTLPAGALPNYLYSAAAIQAAIASPSRGKGMIIPYFGYYRPADIRAKTNSNGFWYLSNYFVSEPANQKSVAVSFTYKGHTYTFNNVEAAYQAGKCLVAGIQLTHAQIQQFVAATPDESKALANTTHAYKYNPRDQQRIDALMTSLVRQKFINGPLANNLDTETGETELVEGNAWDDAIWGMPFDGVKHVPSQKGLQGQNKLGKILVHIRADIRNGIARGSIPAFAI